MSRQINKRIKITLAMAVIIAAMEEEEKEEEEEEDQPKRKRPKYWVNPYLRERLLKGRYSSDFENLLKTPQMFFENFHMMEKSFNKLLVLVEPYLVPKRDTRPDAIPPRAKLAIVLEFLASGDFQRHVASNYRISKQHFGRTVVSVCNSISLVLQGEFPKWTSSNMLQWAKEYQDECHFPNCIGAVGGKHVAIRAPPDSKSLFYNYKEFHSIVLMAICDAFYRFTYIDVGAVGSEGDMNGFTHSEFGKALLLDNMQFPSDNAIHGERTPFFIIGDDAFPLHKRIMKPYSARNLNRKELIFNYRLSRARRCIERAFGILSARWVAVQRTFLCNPSKAKSIVSACCSLHNFLMRESPKEYAIHELSIPSNAVLTDLRPCRRGRPQDLAKEVRDNLMEYLSSSEGYSQVPWQDESAVV